MFVCTYVVHISISRISIYMYHHCCLSSVYCYYRHLIYHCQFLKIIFLFSLNKILSALRWIIIVLILIIIVIIINLSHMCVISKNWLSVNAILFRFIILPHLSNSIIFVIVAIRVGTLWLHMTINLSILSPLIKVNYVSFEIIINTRD